MKKNTVRGITQIVVSFIACITFLAVGIIAQETTVTTGSDSSDSGSTTQSGSGDQIYDVNSSIELGLRAKSVDGNENKYRSDLNYKSGFRLFDSSFLATTEDSTGKPFDSLLITGTGWSADRNGFARFNMEKLGLYKFRSTVRRFEYFNNLLNIAQNQHNRNTKHHIGDFDITVLPQNETVNFRFGYSFDRNSGPQTTTYDFSRDEFLVDSDYDTSANDLRAGVDLHVGGFNVSFTEGYRRFRENTTFSITSLELGNNPNPNASIDTLSRILPSRGTTNYHQLNINKNFNRRVDFSGRLIYSETRTNFSLLQQLTGTNRFGDRVVLDEVRSAGDAKRPNTYGDFGVTVFVTDDFSVSNTFGYNKYQITGGQFLTETVITDPSDLGNGTGFPTVIDSELVYRLTNYKRFINTLQADYDVNRFLSFFLGYRFTDRDVELSGFDEFFGDELLGNGFFESGDNTTHSVLGGLKAKPVPGKWTIFFNMEHGQTDNVFTRTANYDFTHIRARTEVIPVDKLSLSFLFESKDNDNPSRPTAAVPQQFSNELTSRVFTGTVSFAPTDEVTLNGGYSHNRLSTEAGIIFPRFGPVDVGTSTYRLRSNFAFFDGWFKANDRWSIFAAYRITKDTGSGDFFSSSDSVIFGNYPLQFQSPEFRMIFKITDSIDLNAGYQYYDYSEEMLSSQDYQAHLPYVSLRIFFGGAKDRR